MGARDAERVPVSGDASEVSEENLKRHHLEVARSNYRSNLETMRMIRSKSLGNRLMIF